MPAAQRYGLHSVRTPLGDSDVNASTQVSAVNAHWLLTALHAAPVAQSVALVHGGFAHAVREALQAYGVQRSGVASTQPPWPSQTWFVKTPASQNGSPQLWVRSGKVQPSRLMPSHRPPHSPAPVHAVRVP
jgi:hypothetical protein